MLIEEASQKQIEEYFFRLLRCKLLTEQLKVRVSD